MYGDNRDKSYDELFVNYDRLTAEYTSSNKSAIHVINREFDSLENLV